MNKSAFIDELSKELNYDKDKCIIINDILESNFVISKKNKEVIVNELISTLNIDNEEAIKIYEVAVDIIKKEVKNSIKHPFRNKD